MNFIDSKTNFSLKNRFGTEEDKAILISFLNAIFYKV